MILARLFLNLLSINHKNLIQSQWPKRLCHSLDNKFLQIKLLNNFQNYYMEILNYLKCTEMMLED
jgi:hypothetical protein